VWDADERAVYWTDINRFLIHRFTERNGWVKTWFFTEPVTALALSDREDTMVVALGSGVILWNRKTDAREPYHFRLPGWPKVRMNDARSDPLGHFWMGSMRNNVGPDGEAMAADGTDGVLYRLAPDGEVTEWRKDIGISNTLAWNRERDKFYFADTLLNTVWVYDYDAEAGTIQNERTFFAGFDRGKPDGSSMDSEGYLWNCRYGGGCIVRVTPDGKVDAVIDMPVSNITTCVFGGPDLKTLYVTTARGPERLSGSLFTIETDVKGQEENRVRLGRQA
jgi:sugar lactone lactonase YvrE